jgi:transcriptional regulator with XRE-family HTH domain
MDDSFSSRLRDARQRAGLDLAALSQKTGLAFSTLWRIEQGLTTPLWDTLRRIAAACGCGVADLAGEKSTKT